jgi:hypothetical protein
LAEGIPEEIPCGVAVAMDGWTNSPPTEDMTIPVCDDSNPESPAEFRQRFQAASQGSVPNRRKYV